MNNNEQPQRPDINSYWYRRGFQNPRALISFCLNFISRAGAFEVYGEGMLKRKYDCDMFGLSFILAIPDNKVIDENEWAIIAVEEYNSVHWPETENAT